MYNEKHPYFAIRGPLRGKVKDAMREIKANDALAYIKVHTVTNGNNVMAHMDVPHNEFEVNFSVGKILSKLNFGDIKMLPAYTHASVKWPDLPASKFVIEFKGITTNNLETIRCHARSTKKMHRESLWKDRKLIVIFQDNHLARHEIIQINRVVFKGYSISKIGYLINQEIVFFEQ